MGVCSKSHGRGSEQQIRDSCRRKTWYSLVFKWPNCVKGSTEWFIQCISMLPVIRLAVVSCTGGFCLPFVGFFVSVRYILFFISFPSICFSLATTVYLFICRGAQSTMDAVVDTYRGLGWPIIRDHSRLEESHCFLMAYNWKWSLRDNFFFHNQAFSIYLLTLPINAVISITALCPKFLNYQQYGVWL